MCKREKIGIEIEWWRRLKVHLEGTQQRGIYNNIGQVTTAKVTTAKVTTVINERVPI